MKGKLKTNKVKEGVKIISKYFLAYKDSLIFISVLSCVSALANGFVPLLAGKLLDSIISGQMVTVLNEQVKLYVVLLVAWAAVQMVAYMFDWKNSYEAEKLASTIYTDYIVKGVGYILLLPISFHKQTRSGSIYGQIQKTSNSFYNLCKTLVRILPQFLTILVASILLATINYQLLLVLLVGLILYVVILIKTVPQGDKLNEQVFDHWTEAWGYAQDALTNISTVKQFSTEEYEKDRIDKAATDKALKTDLLLVSLWNDLDFYQKIVILGTQVIVFLISIFAIIGGSMTIGELVAFNGYSAMFFGPFIILGQNWQIFQTSVVYAISTEKMLGAKSEGYDRGSGVDENIFKGEIEFNDVYFDYGEGKSILNGVSFKVEPGETIALIGRSGEGKSTLLDLLSGYFFAKKGSITIGGINVKQLSLKTLRSHIGVVPQEVVLFNDTIEKNIAYGGVNRTKDDLISAATKAHAIDFIEKFPKKWKQVVGERGVKLSVGQKQRVAIARAILRDPTILILDEPTSALDAESEHYITKSLENLMKGRTTFIIAHRLSTVRRADKIIVLKDGKIGEIGNHNELIQKPNGLYKHLYDLQTNVKEDQVGLPDLLKDDDGLVKEI